ncbi:MAG: CPBP family intramembrane metalloprotease, partial [Bacteroidaceae bacterium]|nr:CPBP family intramembrane metalloprotease [Bacteroidaceae bacterium]
SLSCKDYQTNSLALGLSFLISSVITIAIYWAARYWTESKEAIKNIPKKLYLRLFIIALASFIPSAWLLEITGVEVNEQQERILMEICNSPFGFIVIAILVPLAEEIVFRGSVLRVFLNFNRPWLAIVISAMLFGLVHGNTAQFIHATLLGILLGYVYYKTGSILPGVFLHFINNLATFVMIKVNPDIANDATLLEMYNGNAINLYCSLVLFTLILVHQLLHLKKDLHI